MIPAGADVGFVECVGLGLLVVFDDELAVGLVAGGVLESVGLLGTNVGVGAAVTEDDTTAGLVTGLCASVAV